MPSLTATQSVEGKLTGLARLQVKAYSICVYVSDLSVGAVCVSSARTDLCRRGGKH
ncbi:MAG: hypothetical protein ACI9JR_000451 [Gammaproteobacteria bacterium]|jgi:hypothetical protein